MKTVDKLKVLKILTNLPEEIKFLGKPDMEYLKKEHNITDIYSKDYLNTVLNIVVKTPEKEFTQTREDGVNPISKDMCVSVLLKVCTK